MSQFAIIVAGAAVAAVALIFLLFKLMWRVAEPNEALVISGLRADRPSDQVGESLGFKIVTGKGTLVIPGVQQVRRLSLDLREAELGLDSIETGVRGAARFAAGEGRGGAGAGA